VLEHVDGVDLAKLIAAGPIPHTLSIFLAMEILSGLDYAHNVPAAEGRRGVVHRDLSPHNVLLSWEGAVKVSDFGLAKFCQTICASASAELQGKIAFMSPEQANGRPLDGRSDLFSVGIMLWEMVTGRRLFRREREDAKTTLCRVLIEPIASPSAIAPVASDVEAVVMRLLERDPARRYATAAEARVALAACAPASGCERVQLGQLLAERFPHRAPPMPPAPIAAAGAPARRDPTWTLPPAKERWWPPMTLPRWWKSIALVLAALGVLGLGIVGKR
jgi:serine/threonine protein kinase